MPTGKGMFGVARARAMVVAIVVATTGSFGAVAAGATPVTTTTPTTAPAGPVAAIAGTPSATDSTTVPAGPTTTVPPPPPFALPADYGLQLVQALDSGHAALTAGQAELPRARTALTRAVAHDREVKADLRRLQAKERETQRQLDASKLRLRQAAAAAYIHAGSGELMAAVSSMLNASSAVDIGSQLHVIGSFSRAEQDTLAEYVGLRRVVERQLANINTMARTSARDLTAARRHVADVTKAIADANAKIKIASMGIVQFQAAATSATSPILGPSRLTAKQMADYIVFSGYKPRITVPIQELAQDYIDEGVKTGVRGDVAFAQSILETGGFANPGSAATDNNFAGIGWCDSCAHGFNFPDARTGVRGQLQLLRIYVDPAFPGPDYKDPILLPGTLKLGFRGKVQTWWDLWGTWATAALYGQRVYDIYEKMVAFAAFDTAPATPAPQVSGPTTTTTVPGSGSPNGVTRPPGSGPGSKP